MNIIDRTSNFNAWTNKSPKAKVLFGLGALLLALIINNVYFHIFQIVFISSLILFGAKVSHRVYLKLLAIPLGFLVLSIITIIFSVSEDLSLFYKAIPIKQVYLGITVAGLQMGAELFFRALAAIISTYFISTTTPMTQFIQVMKAWHVPQVLLEMMVLTYRFITIFIEHFNRMQVAIEVKGGARTRWLQVKNNANLGYGLFRSVMDSYETWKLALDVKLYNGNFYI